MNKYASKKKGSHNTARRSRSKAIDAARGRGLVITPPGQKPRGEQLKERDRGLTYEKWLAVHERAHGRLGSA